MLNLSTIPLKELVKDYGPLFAAGATVSAAVVASVAARAALRSARAAEFNAQTSRQSMEIANRAYVSIISAGLLHTLQVGKKPMVIGTFKNVGKTPAFNTKTVGEFTLTSEPNGYGFRQALSESFSIYTLAPDQEMLVELSCDFVLSQSDIMFLDEQRNFLFFWGELTYEDVFHNHHQTGWCFRYDRSSKTGLLIHSDGNEMT